MIGFSGSRSKVKLCFGLFLAGVSVVLAAFAATISIRGGTAGTRDVFSETQDVAANADLTADEINSYRELLGNLKRQRDLLAMYDPSAAVGAMMSDLRRAQIRLDKAASKVRRAAGAPPPSPAPVAPRAFYSDFQRIPCIVRLVNWDVIDGRPSYDFEVTYQEDAFPPENCMRVRLGEMVSGYVVGYVDTRMIPGSEEERKVGRKRNGDPIYKTFKNPNFTILRMILRNTATGGEQPLEVPISKSESEKAALSGFHSIVRAESWVPAAQVTRTGDSPDSTNCELVKRGRSFMFLAKTYQVISVDPNYLELESEGVRLHWRRSEMQSGD